MLPPQNPPSQQIPATDSGANNNMYNSGGFGGLQNANINYDHEQWHLM